RPFFSAHLSAPICPLLLLLLAADHRYEADEARSEKSHRARLRSRYRRVDRASVTGIQRNPVANASRWAGVVIVQRVRGCTNRQRVLRRDEDQRAAVDRAALDRAREVAEERRRASRWLSLSDDKVEDRLAWCHWERRSAASQVKGSEADLTQRVRDVVAREHEVEAVGGARRGRRRYRRASA